MRRRLFGALSNATRVLAFLPVPLVVFNFYPIRKIVGRSMQPTLNPDASKLRQDFGLFDSVSVQAAQDFQRGDIVLVTSPNNPKYTVVKRVIALEGDTVTTLPPYPEAQVRVPPGHVWIEGDDPAHSDDSRSYGPVRTINAKHSLANSESRFGKITTPTPEYLSTLTRDGPAYRAAVATMQRDRRRETRVTRAAVDQTN